MIRIQTFKIGISPSKLIQQLVNILNIENGQIIIKIQNKKFIHLYLQPSFKPEELENTEIENNDKI